MIRIIVVIVALLAMTLAPASAAVDRWIVVKVDGDRFFVGDTVVLDIDSTGLEEPIDFSTLDAISEIGRQTVGTRIAVINGQVVEIRSIRLDIEPKRAGHITIGPLTAGSVASNTVVIDVEAERPPQWEPTAEDADMMMTVSQARPWLQQELVLDIRLRHRHPISDEKVTLPDLAEFRVTPIFEERRTIETTDGGWAVLAWRYLIYPQHSGPATISAPEVEATLSRTRVERARINLSANPITLDVRPASDLSHWWLPARKVILKDAWSQEPTGLSAGDEVTRTITVEADGVRPEQIPDVVMAETRGFQITRAGARRSGATGEAGSKATASFDFKLRAVSPVAIFVDTVRLPWWDTQAGQARNAIIPARRIEIGMPDREKLLENAGGNPLLDQLPQVSWPMAAICLGAILALLAALALTRRGRPSDPALALLKSASRRLDTADVRGAIDLFRTLPRGHALWPAVATIRSSLEMSLVEGNQEDCARTASADTRRLLHNAGRVGARPILPPL